MTLELAPAEVEVEPLAGGGMILRSPRPLEPYERHPSARRCSWAPSTVSLAFDRQQ